MLFDLARKLYDKVLGIDAWKDLQQKEFDGLRTLVQQIAKAQEEIAAKRQADIFGRFDPLDATLNRIESQISPGPPVSGKLFLGTPVAQ